jgi:hypothetical protein
LPALAMHIPPAPTLIPRATSSKSRTHPPHTDQIFSHWSK